VILAALAFSLSVPAGKVLLADVSPLALSGVFYLSAGLLCLVLIILGRRPLRSASEGNTIRGAEWAWLAAAVASGGVLAPLALLSGLRGLSGNTAGLLLNFELIFTFGIGALLAGERVGRRGWIGAAAILAGTVLLSPTGARPLSNTVSHWPHALLILAARLCPSPGDSGNSLPQHDRPD
jgi:drug/metabolite transporter (DMT)-like permease